ncbi:DUF3618 domain-containing protein [Streptomyces sp. B6B3]|uniref:DUF3618 domain-containing protein n=1 Tax=Streptomyces sp. B6B3 TaxID=3153570 RepID=UPI00325EBF07
MGTSPERLRAEIDETRARLTDELDRLADHVSPRRAAGRQGERLRGAASGLRSRMPGGDGQGTEQMRGRARHASQSMRGAAGQAGEAARHAPGRAAHQAGGNPLATGIVAFGAGLLAGAALPETDAERQAATRVTERAGEYTGPAKATARESAQRLRDEARATARHAAMDVKARHDHSAESTEAGPAGTGGASKPW